MIQTVNDISRDEINRVLKNIQNGKYSNAKDRGRSEKDAQISSFRTNSIVAQSITTFATEYIIAPVTPTVTISTTPIVYGWGSDYGNNWGA
jgi:hypothetical protein